MPYHLGHLVRRVAHDNLLPHYVANCARQTRMMRDIGRGVTPSASRRFRVAPRPAAWAAAACGASSRARPRRRSRRSPPPQPPRQEDGQVANGGPALRVARQHGRLAAREPDLDGPGLDISRRLDAQAHPVRGLADGDRERGGRRPGPRSSAGRRDALMLLPGDISRTGRRHAPAT